MLMQADVGKPLSAHVIVLGNEKGGSGKSTTAMHVAVALLQAGQRVATIDLDSRQKSFTHYIENRRDWAERTRIKLDVPKHFCVARGFGLRLDDIEAQEFAAFAEAVSTVESTHDFVVIDTPGSDSYMMRLAHSMADTLITPINDSFVDFDVLGTIDPETFALTGTSHYGEMVREVRRIGSRHGIETAAYGHAGDGNLHVNLLLESREDTTRINAAIGDVMRAAVALGGTITGEHGVGLAKKGYLALEQSPALIAAQRRVKTALDPDGILNPGKIFPDEA